jgi:hypothetical protein
MYTRDYEKWLLAEVVKLIQGGGFVVRILGLPDDMVEQVCPPERLRALVGEDSVASLPAETVEQIEVQTNRGWVNVTVLARGPGNYLVHFNAYPDSENETVPESMVRKLAVFNVPATEQFAARLCRVGKDRPVFAQTARKRAGKYWIDYGRTGTDNAWVAADRVIFEPRDQEEGVLFAQAQRAFAGKPEIGDPVFLLAGNEYKQYEVFEYKDGRYRLKRQVGAVMRVDSVPEAEVITALPYLNRKGEIDFASLVPSERSAQ